MALSDRARQAINTACGELSVGDEVQTKMMDKTVANTIAGTQTFSGTVTLSGALDHDGTTIGFFGVTPTTRASAYTQTYSTADKTLANLTMADLTDNSGGTAADTVAAITTGGTAADQGPTRNAIATLVREQARAKADIADIKQALNSVIDDLQAYGILQ